MRIDTLPAEAERIRARVIGAIAGNRTPGLHFPGHFLDFRWEEVGGGSARAVLNEGPHCRNADGTLSVVALGIFADNLLGAAARTVCRPGVRLGTIFLSLQFTGAPVRGDLDAASQLLGSREGVTLPHSLTSAILHAQGRPVCHVRGEFLQLDPPSGVVLGPLPWERAATPPAEPIEMDGFEPAERTILAACDTALAKASPEASFIEHFWGGQPRRTVRGAVNRIAIGPQIANRVGHVQGGILLGLAATTAAKAAPAGMMMSNVSAWYIHPGLGEHLRVRSTVLHAGRTTAVVRTRILADSGQCVLETVSHHVAGDGGRR